MQKNVLKHSLTILFVSTITGASFGLYTQSKTQPAESFITTQDVESPQLPQGTPQPGEASIKVAMDLFHIQLPENVSYPVYEPTLEERGVTTGYLLGKSKQIKIGPSAFISWSILGSTLGHEIEVHGRQSFLKITLADSTNTFKLSARRLVGNWIPALKLSATESFEAMGTWKAEREAYMYEINSAKRFGLTAHEQFAIHRVMEDFFPSQTQKKNPSNS